MLHALGKGPGFFIVAETAVVGLLLLAGLKVPVDWSAFAIALGVVVGAYFGGGGWKAKCEAKANGTSASASGSGASSTA